MAVRTEIKDGGGTNVSARVTKRGELVVSASGTFSKAYNATAAVADTAYNFVGPSTSQQFVITGILLKANQNVSNTTDAIVTLYEATAPDTATVSSTILEVAMVRGDQLTIPANLLVTPGVWVNLKTTDDDVYGTLMGYYVNV